MVAECLKPGSDENSNLHSYVSRNFPYQIPKKFSRGDSKEPADLKTLNQQCEDPKSDFDEDEKNDNEQGNEDTSTDTLYPLEDWIEKETNYIFRADLQDATFLEQCANFEVQTKSYNSISEFFNSRNVLPLTPLPESVVSTDPYHRCGFKHVRHTFQSTPIFLVPYEPGYVFDPLVPYEKSPIITLKKPRGSQSFPVYTYL